MLISMGSNNIVNLDNVTNVLVDEKNKKIIFNMNYSVRIDTIITSDYTYWKYESDEDVNKVKKVLRECSFIEPNNPTNRWVNMKNVASIKVDEKTLKVIYNLSCSITHPEDSRAIKQGELDHVDARLTSDYVFIKFDSMHDFSEYVGHIYNNSKFIELS